MRTRAVAIGVAVASSSSMRSGRSESESGPITTPNRSIPTRVLARSRGPGRVRAAHVEQMREAMSGREWAALRAVAKLRLVTGKQLERLCFAEDLGEASRAVVRRRVLGRLVRARVLTTLVRRIGGVHAGSAGLVYHLDTAGLRLLAAESTARRMDPPGERYMRHVLAVSELYVALVERAREGEFRLVRFAAEPASWWPDGRNGLLKPDASIRVANEDHHDSWWAEVDLATESLPTLGRKLTAYLDFYNRGQLGPGKIMPWVLVTAPNAKRYSDIVRLIRQLPRQADELFTVAVHNDAAEVIMRRLGQS